MVFVILLATIEPSTPVNASVIVLHLVCTLSVKCLLLATPRLVMPNAAVSDTQADDSLVDRPILKFIDPPHPPKLKPFTVTSVAGPPLRFPDGE
jgi:hypothetical protein